MAAMSFIPSRAANSAPVWVIRLVMVFLTAVATLGAFALLSNGVWVGGLVFVVLAVLTVLLAVLLRKPDPARRKRP